MSFRIILNWSMIVLPFLVWSQSTDSILTNDPLLAKVNEQEIRLSYLYNKIEELSLGDQIDVRAQIPRFLESVIQEEVLFQSMIANNFAEESELREEVKSVVVEYLIQKYVSSQIQISEEDIMRYYEKNQSVIRDEHVQVRQILLKQREECEEMMKRIDSDETFQQMARQHSLNKEAASDNGFLGHFMNHNGILGFEKEFFNMKQGEMKIFENSEGCHLIRQILRFTPPLPKLEEVREQIRFVIYRNQEIKLLRQLITSHSQNIKIERQEVSF